MRKSIIVVFVVLMAIMAFTGCGFKNVNLAKAHFITSVANNPEKFTKSDFRLADLLVIDNNVRPNPNKEKTKKDDSFLDTRGMSEESKRKLEIYMSRFK